MIFGMMNLAFQSGSSIDMLCLGLADESFCDCIVRTVMFGGGDAFHHRGGDIFPSLAWIS